MTASIYEMIKKVKFFCWILERGFLVMASYILTMRGITKKYPGVTALNNVDFDLKLGEVHALVGENGAGKSTLMKVLAGAVQKDAGTIDLKGKTINIGTPIESQKHGIAIIYQERSLIPYLNGAQNILLGHEPIFGRIGLLKKDELFLKAKKVIDIVAPGLPLDKPVKYLSTAQQQLIEIAKAISVQADIIIMDEPTSSLSDNEVVYLFNVIKMLKSENKGIIYISHRMEEIFNIADRITVMRDGHKISTMPAEEADQGKIVSLMVGRNIENLFPKTNDNIGDEILHVENLSRKDVFEGINFSVKMGEILGIAGLVGSGRTELMRAIFGADKFESGSIYLDNKQIKIKSPRSLGQKYKNDMLA